ncbi:MAG: hypothetical protein ACRD9S_14500 [Pyrinomonadaceae bacterium]
MRTTKHVLINSWLAGRAVLIVLVIFLLPFAASPYRPSAQTKSQTKPSPPNQSVLRATVKTSFGSAVEVVSSFSPYYLTGDFNGDGAQDLLIVVRIKGPRTELESDVKIYNPFERPKAVYPANPSANPTLALAIIHGSIPGWQTPPPLEKFMLFGDTPILILNYGRVTSGETIDKKDLMELLRKRSTKFRGDGWPPTAAKGDSIVLGTEATDSILYWNGKNYRWEEAAGGE